MSDLDDLFLREYDEEADSEYCRAVWLESLRPRSYQQEKNNPMNLAIANVRCSWPQLFEAKAMKPTDKPKFSMTAILDKKEHAADIKAVEAAMKAVAEEKWGVGKVPKAVKYCLRDGSEKEDVDGYGPGVMFMPASSNEDRRPSVVDKDNAPLDGTQNKPYAGCYVDVSVRFWAQDNEYGKRVNAQLRAVRFRKDGKPFGESGPVDAAKDFANVPAPEDEGSAID